MGPGNFLEFLPNTFQVFDESLVIGAALGGARKIAEGCTVAVTLSAIGCSKNRPRSLSTRCCLPITARAAVAPRQTITSDWILASSAFNQGQHAVISDSDGLL